MTSYVTTKTKGKKRGKRDSRKLDEKRKGGGGWK